MIYKSTHKYARISPTKVRRVAHVMVGRTYDEAMAYLKYLPHAGARLIKSVAHTAAANALSQNSQLNETSLVISSILVDEGPRMKRMWARGRGRADVLLKRFSHITVAISDEGNVHAHKRKQNKGVRSWDKK